MAAYQAATGNVPTYSEFSAAVAGIRQGALTVSSLFESLAAGPNYTVANLYQNLLARAPTASEINTASAAGVNSWFETLIGYPASNTPAAVVDNEFQSTGVFASATSAAGDHTNALYVRMLYFMILLRDPDPPGFAYWVGVANTGGAGVLFQGSTAQSVRFTIQGTGPGQGLAGSPEFQALY